MNGGAFAVLEGGLLTTVQDAGRPDWGHLGVPESGAADPSSLAIANLLVGNEPGAAALEMTFAGPTLVARRPLTIALAGADLHAAIRGGRRLAPGRSHRLAAGDIVEIPGDAGATPATASRGYFSVAGGVDVPIVLGSRSTCLAAGFGGFDGRVLRAGDAIKAGDGGASGDVRGQARTSRELVWPDPAGDRSRAEEGIHDRAILRVLAGPGADASATLAILAERPWRVGSAADRVGLRLHGDPLPDGLGGEATTGAVRWGAIQVPPDGRPIILGADHQATGGYRVVGVVISADLPILGQLRPEAPVGLVATDRTTALTALRERRDALQAGVAALREAAGWDALIDAAGS